MPTDTHQKYMRFIGTLSSLLSEHSHHDLNQYRRMARRGFPHLVPVIEACIKMRWRDSRGISSERVDEIDSSQSAHLFDLLRSRELFPNNADLAGFAARVLPGLTKRRFDKMSKADIAGRIIEYLETLQTGKRHRLEQAMREAMRSQPGAGKKDRESFFTQWENIIKGIEL